MENFLGNSSGTSALHVTSRYLDGHAHEWWVVHKQTVKGSAITTCSQLKNNLVQRLQTLNKEKIAQEKLAGKRD